MKKTLPTPSLLVNPPRDEAIRNVLHQVAAAYGVREHEIIGRTRTQTIAEARSVAFYLIPGSLHHVGDMFGRHHTSVLHARKTIAGYCEVYPEFKARIEQIRARALNNKQ